MGTKLSTALIKCSHVRVPLQHLQASPAAECLNAAKVHSGRDPSACEGVAEHMPALPVQTADILTGLSERPFGTLDGGAIEIVGPWGCVREQALSTIPEPPSDGR